MSAELRLQEQADLKAYNTLGLPARARILAEVTSEDALRDLLASDTARRLPLQVIGGGSNLVLAGDVEALVLRPCLMGRRVLSDDGVNGIVEACAGENWHAFTQWTLAAGWGGLENLSLIPGTVGAAPVQNIGAYGVELADVLHSLTVWDRVDGCLRELLPADCRFAYRDSLFKSGEPGRHIITRVRFRLSRQSRLHMDYGDIRRELEAQGVQHPSPADVARAVIAIRQAKLPDPAQLGNAGSFFKNPVVPAAQAEALRQAHPGLVGHAQADGSVKLAAGWLIEQAGWKGRRQGAVGVHDRQALVLVHFGGGRGADLLALAADIQASVLARFGVALEREPVVLGAQGG